MKKEAYFKMFGLNKKSGVKGQMASTILSGMIPYIGPYTGLPGTVAKALAMRGDTSSYDEDQTVGYLPGVSSYRLEKRRNEIPAVIGAKKNDQTTHEFIGGIVGRLLGTLGGATAGGALGVAAGNGLSEGEPEGKLVGGLVGAGVGAGVGLLAPELVAALAALIKRKRTLEQQKAYEESSGISNYFPGVSSYNQWKNYGVLMGDEYQAARKKKHSKNKQPGNKEPDLQLARKAKAEADKDPFGGIKIVKK